MRSEQKTSRSVFVNVLNKDPRPGQPFFALALFVSVILDALRIVLGFILHLFAIVIISAVVMLMIVYLKAKPEYDEYMEEAAQIVEDTTPETFRYNETTVIYDNTGKTMARLSQDSDTVYLDYDSIPSDVVNAFVAVENRTFWDDPGVDVKSIGRVIYDAVRTRGQEIHGASTITQQLARAIFLNNGVTMDRKLKEMALAVKLTEKYSKKDIMEFYVNNVYFANGYYGIEAASKGYFGKSADALSLSEIAYLCAIPNSPVFYDPYNDPERAIERRDHILESMYDVGFISWQELEESKTEVIKINPPSTIAGGYDVTYAIDCAIRYFMKLDHFEFRYTFETKEDQEAYRAEYLQEYEEMRKELYRGGYKIYTSINPKTQKIVQDILDEYIAEIEPEGIDDLQAACVLTGKDGMVEAIIGGTSASRDSFGFNRGFQAMRQPGSSIKPLIVYMPAIIRGCTPETIVNNISVADALALEKRRAQTGQSYDIQQMPGTQVTMRHALEQSLNGAAYTLFDANGIANSMSFLELMRYRNIVLDDYTMSACLGGLTYGVSPEEMAGAYACLANGGQFNEPTCLIRITDRYGADRYTKESATKVYPEESVAVLKDIMEGVMIRGTAAGLGWYNETDVKAYVKTGTTDSQKDGWMCGWTEDGTDTKVLSVWVGCDTPKKLSGLWGSTWPGTLWKKIMLAV